jgi:hypothetical protein
MTKTKSNGKGMRLKNSIEVDENELALRDKIVEVARSWL